MTESHALRMMRLFEGFAGAHGTHGGAVENSSKGGKLEIKKTARTLREPVTVDLWERHLSGERPLGIIPVREDGMCLWGCIDVDKYDLDLGGTVRMLRDKGIPLVLCRSKSGGAHCFIFLAQPTPVAEVRARLRQMAASMGWGDCEVFPKQDVILDDRGDLGNWLNMPYLGGDETDRYAVRENMTAMSLSQFLETAEKSRVAMDAVPQPAEPEDETLSDGPPCLQHLAAVGFPEGTRNNGLFGLGTFCKKKFGERWKEVLERYNRDFMDPPLSSDEVLGVIKQLEKKDYFYRCGDEPIKSYCNSALCRTRRHGVGGSGKYPVISDISKLETDPPLWFVSIDDHRLQFTTEQLFEYKSFQKVCAERMTTYFITMKKGEFEMMMNSAMEKCHPLEAPPEVSIHGHFEELLADFITDRHKGSSPDDLFLGKPWQDTEGERGDAGLHYFRLRDLMKHLQTEGFREWGRNMVAQAIDEMGGKKFFNINGRGVNVFWVPDRYSDMEPSALPESRSDPI